MSVIPPAIIRGARPIPTRHSQLLSALIVVTSLSAAANARVPSESGRVSRSTIAISASVAPRILVSGIRDIRGAELAYSAVEPKRLDLCVIANSGLRTYNVTAYGRSDGSGFFLADARGRRLPFAVEWATNSASHVPALLSPGVAAHGFLASGRGCTGGEVPGTILLIRLRPSSGQPAAPENSRRAVLTLLIAPD